MLFRTADHEDDFIMKPAMHTFLLFAYFELLSIEDPRFHCLQRLSALCGERKLLILGFSAQQPELGFQSQVFGFFGGNFSARKSDTPFCRCVIVSQAAKFRATGEQNHDISLSRQLYDFRGELS